MNKLYEIYVGLQSLTIFKNLLEDSVIGSLSDLLSLSEEQVSLADGVALYAAFAGNLYEETDDLASYILKIVTDDENVYIKKCAAGEQPSHILASAVNAELELLQKISKLTPDDLRKLLVSKDGSEAEGAYTGYLPAWKNSEVDLKKEYSVRVANIGKYGFGMYAKYHMFYVKDEHLVPIKHPDPQSLKELIGYNNERNAVINNTLALLAGKPAANALLYGDAGTGKSSTVKAIGNEFYKEGLRIIEVRKEQLSVIPAIFDEISSLPLKFIIFIDDLSFSTDDDNFGGLKAILEGSASSRSNNVVIYATSNRRHIVKEKFSDRQGDDIHRNDAMQETISLSERFGLRVYFGKPDKNCYIEIARELAKSHGIEISDEELALGAEQFAMNKGGRSARGAKQFIDSLRSKKED